MKCDEIDPVRCFMLNSIKNTFVKLSVIGSLFIVWNSHLFANESLYQQELVLEQELKSANSSEQIAKITFALANIKRQQSHQELKKLPDMVGRDRSFLTASVKDSLSYRQMASSFKSEPAVSSISYSYKIGNFLAMSCIVMGCIFLVLRLRYRY